MIQTMPDLQNRCRFLEKAKKQHWDDNNFCEKLTSKKHGKDSGHVGNNFKRLEIYFPNIFSSKKRCMKAVKTRAEIRKFEEGEHKDTRVESQGEGRRVATDNRGECTPH